VVAEGELASVIVVFSLRVGPGFVREPADIWLTPWLKSSVLISSVSLVLRIIPV
jgi:hypothetical protein